jgi:hypothetical protein
MALRTFSFIGWTWSAVIVGTIAALMFQVLLAMLGYGFGLLTIDVPTADSAPKAVSWAVFTWWAVSGVMSAFVGGWIAATFAEEVTSEGRAAHALAAWALSALIVIGTAGLTAGSSASVMSNLAGPSATAFAQYNRYLEPRAQTVGSGGGAAAPSRSQLEQARRHTAVAMIASFVALLVGAGAAVAGSQWLPTRPTRRA